MQQVKKIGVMTLGVLVSIYVLRQVPFARPMVDKALVG